MTKESVRGEPQSAHKGSCFKTWLPCCLIFFRSKCAITLIIPQKISTKAITHLCEPGRALWTEDTKYLIKEKLTLVPPNFKKQLITDLLLKKSREPEKTMRALFRACRPAISSVLLPTAWGYWSTNTTFTHENKYSYWNQHTSLMSSSVT